MSISRRWRAYVLGLSSVDVTAQNAGDLPEQSFGSDGDSGVVGDIALFVFRVKVDLMAPVLDRQLRDSINILNCNA
jgi:hypothetical protein